MSMMFSTRALAFSALSVAAISVTAPVWAAPPVRSLIAHPVSPAPSGADGVRIRLYGDKSGGTVQVRLTAPAEDGVLSGYYAAAPIVLDFEGWKTVVLPLASFVFGSDTNPDTAQDGLGRKETLSASTGVQLAVTGSSTRIAINELAWATGDNASAPMETFDAASLKQWKPLGDYDQIRSVRFGGVEAGELAEGGKPSLQIIVRNVALNEQQINKPPVDVRLKKTPQLPYAIYVRNAFEPICAESVPSLREIAAPPTLKITACPDETEPGSFSVYSLKEIKNATVRIVGAFTAAGGVSIPASAVDVRVVRVGNGYPAPQLLMKDDRQPLTGPLPVVRLTGEPTTDIAAGTSKQFWVTVHVPANAAPGAYQGKLIFSANGVKPTGIPVTINVADLTLKTAFLQYGIELHADAASNGETPAGETISQETYAAQLANIRDHGFRMVQIFPSSGHLENAIRLYKAANMSLVGPMVVAVNSNSDAGEAEGMKNSVGLPPNFDIYYYLSPNTVNGGDVRGIGGAINAANKNALVAAVVESTDVYKRLCDALDDQTGEKLAPIYPISSDYAQKVLSEGKRFTQNRDYWRWSIPDQSPIRNRAFSGFLLFKTGPGFYGAFPGPYQRSLPGVSPYAAFEEGMTLVSPRPAMTTFPVEGGVLDTIQWEAAREGVNDIRYIGALKANIRELKDAKKAKDATDAAEAALAAFEARPLITLSPADYQAARTSILEQAVELKYILQPSLRRAAPALPKTSAPAKKTPARAVKRG